MTIKEIIPTKSFNLGTVKGSRVLKRSLEQLGFCRSIVVDRNNKVLVGNKVYQNALEKNAKIVLVETQGDELVVIKRKDIDYDTRKAREIMLTDNLTAEQNLSYDTNYIIETMNKVWGFDPRIYEGHSCLVQELSVEDCIKEGLQAVEKKAAKQEEPQEPDSTQLFLF